jgi:hypothetical protein
MVVEGYEEAISKADGNIVLDGVRRAFNLVKAQACMLATLLIPAIQEFLLPVLKNTWHNVLRKHKGLAASHSMSRVDEAVGGTLWTTARSWTSRIETRVHAGRCMGLRFRTTRRALYYVKCYMQEDVAVCRHEVESFILLTLGGC